MKNILEQMIEEAIEEASKKFGEKGVKELLSKVFNDLNYDNNVTVAEILLDQWLFSIEPNFSYKFKSVRNIYGTPSIELESVPRNISDYGITYENISEFSILDDIIKNKPDGFDVISGDDGFTCPLITLGAVGVISVIGNAFPREFSKMTRLALQGDYANALTIHHRFTELFKLLFVDGNPAGVKCILNAMGMIENKLRLPLIPTRIKTFEAIRKVLDELNIKC